MKAMRHSLLLLAAAGAAGLCLGTPVPAAPSAAASRPAEPTEKDWQDASAAIRRIALDKAEAEDHRTDAVRAYARLQLARGRPDEALALCRQVLESPDRPEILAAAIRAGCMVQRHSHGHLRAELDFLAACAGGAGAHAAAAAEQEIQRAIQAAGSLVGRSVVPAAAAVRAPHWATAEAGKAPSALVVSLPKVDPPTWLKGVTFPLLKDPKGK
jgi:hypothetical protein